MRDIRNECKIWIGNSEMTRHLGAPGEFRRLLLKQFLKQTIGFSWLQIWKMASFFHSNRRFYEQVEDCQLVKVYSTSLSLLCLQKLSSLFHWRTGLGGSDNGYKCTWFDMFNPTGRISRLSISATAVLSTMCLLISFNVIDKLNAVARGHLHVHLACSSYWFLLRNFRRFPKKSSVYKSIIFTRSEINSLSHRGSRKAECSSNNVQHCMKPKIFIQTLNKHSCGETENILKRIYFINILLAKAYLWILKSKYGSYCKLSERCNTLHYY